MAVQVVKQTTQDLGDGRVRVKSEIWQQRFRFFSPPTWPIFRWAYNVYMNNDVIRVGHHSQVIGLQIIHKDRKTYQYSGVSNTEHRSEEE